MRQLYDASGQVLATNRYDPYGSLMSHYGEATSVFGYTGEQYDSYIELLYLRARWYDDGTGRFTQPDPIIPDYANLQSLDQYVYVYNNPVRYTDPSGRDPNWCDSQPDPQACYHQYLLPSQPFVKARVYYLNQIGNEAGAPVAPDPKPSSLEGYIVYRVGLVVGAENVKSIPIFKGPRWPTWAQMILEACEIRSWSPIVADAIDEDLKTHALGADRLVIIGNSGGGTVAVESLDLLKAKGIFVDQLILRGSLVQEFWLSNVRRVDYITSDFHGLPADYYYSWDTNPFDSVQVQEHRLEFIGHVPPDDRVNKQIADLIVELLIEGGR